MSPALKAIVDRRLVLWAPTDNGKLLNLLGELLKIAKGGAQQINLKLLVTFDPIVGCDCIDTLLELWHHICLNPKYKPVIKGHTLFDLPMRCVVTGGAGPLHVVKSIMMVHVCNIGEIIPPQLLPWKLTLLKHDLGPVILIDFPSDQLLRVQTCIDSSALPGHIGWDSPRRSPAHHPGTPRHVICGFSDANLVSALEITLIVKDLRNKEALQGCMIGPQSLLNDTTSYVVDCGDINILSTCHWLMQETLVISKKRVLMTSLHPKHIWEQVVTQQAQENPSSAVTSIKFRKRLNMPTSIVWLKPLLLQEDLQRSRQLASVASRSKEEQARVNRHAFIRIEGLSHVEHDMLCVELMTKVTQVLQIPLGRASTITPNSNEWAICYSSEGEFAQKIAIQFDSEEAIQKLIAHVHGCGIKVGGKNLIAEVKSLHPQFKEALHAGRSEGASVTAPSQQFLELLDRGGQDL